MGFALLGVCALCVVADASIRRSPRCGGRKRSAGGGIGPASPRERGDRARKPAPENPQRQDVCIDMEIAEETCRNSAKAPVVQWLGYAPSKHKIRVRFPAGVRFFPESFLSSSCCLLIDQPRQAKRKKKRSCWVPPCWGAGFPNIRSEDESCPDPGSRRRNQAFTWGHRTEDRTNFSRALSQLSYLGDSRNRAGCPDPPTRPFIIITASKCVHLTCFRSPFVVSRIPRYRVLEVRRIWHI